jgi:hypothetical protein
MCSEAAGQIVALLRCLDNFKILAPASSDIIHMLSHAALVCGKSGSGYLFLTKSCCYSSMPTTQLYHKTNMPLQQKPTSSNAVSGCRRSAAFGHQPLSSDSSLKDVSPDPSSFLSLRAYPMALVVKGGKELTAKHRNTVRGLQSTTVPCSLADVLHLFCLDITAFLDAITPHIDGSVASTRGTASPPLSGHVELLHAGKSRDWTSDTAGRHGEC